MTAGYVSSGERIRHSRKNPCRLCGGGGDYPPHHPQRCRGYEQGDYVYCQRVIAPRDGPIETYRHWLGGACDCGTNHSGATRPVYVPPARQNVTDNIGTQKTTEKPLGVEKEIDRYDYPIEGLGVYQKIRFERWHEGVRTERRFEWRSPSGAKHLPQGGIGNLRMYGIDRYKDLPRDGSVALTIVEGEKAAKSLWARGFRAISWGGGGGSVPGPIALDDLRGFAIVQWPDQDAVGAAQVDKYLPGLRSVGCSVWRLDVSAAAEHEDAYDWVGTPDELEAYFATAVKIDAPLVEAGPDAAAAAVEHVDMEHRRKKTIRDRLEVVTRGAGDEDMLKHAAALKGCMELWIPAICNGCGARPAFLSTCHDNICPLCAPGRFKHDWQVMIDRNPELKAERFRTVRWAPLEPVSGTQALKLLRNRFTEQRKRDHLQAGIIGNRTSRRHGGVILTALPMSVAVPEELFGTFSVEVVAEDVDEREVSTWLWAEYEDEIVEAAEAAEAGDMTYFRDWLASTRGRKRFSAFGKLWCTPPYNPIEDDRTLSGGADDAVAVSIAGFTGGSGNAGTREKRKCPFCGSTRLTKYAIKLPAERLTHARGHAEWVAITA